MSRAGLHTVSLRRRVIVSGVLVITAVLLLLGLATDLLFGAQTRRDTNATLREKAQLAEVLSKQGVGPRALVARIETATVKARLTTDRGLTIGNAEAPSVRPRPGPGGPHRVGQDAVLERELADGSLLLLVADGAPATAAQSRLRRLLLGVGLGALAVAAVALVAVVRVALAPLDSMTAVAQSIARGDRGRRLSPTHPDTELGRAASAFDRMVDALEGAERTARHAEATARASEGRTRQFVADAAHELRTPIAGVQAAAEAVLQAGQDSSQEERDRLHLLLVREARRAGLLVSDLLALARIEAGLDLQRSTVDLAALARAEAERTRLLAPGVEVTVSAGDPVLAFADPERIAQVLANLLDNARRHTLLGGPPRIPGQLGEHPRNPGPAGESAGGEITVRVARTGQWAELSVADTGPGVRPEDRERIFDRLVRLDAARAADSGGAGLGLAIARGIARAHGGDLRCDEPASRGALFVLTLPVPPTGLDAPTVPAPSPTARDHIR